MSVATKNYPPYFNFLLGLTAFVGLILVCLGGYVRATGAGLSCPDWPLCFGKAIPHTFDNGVFQEVVHRYLASIVSIGIISISAIVILKRVNLKRPVAYALISILILQIILGGLTVLMKLNPFIVTSHLALGTILLQLLASTIIEIKYLKLSSTTDSSGKFWILSLGIVAFIQLLVGGFVASSGSALVCSELPFCGMELHGQQVLHMSHRIVGISLLLLMAVGIFVARSKNVKSYLKFAFALTFLQISVGLLLVLYRVPVSLSVFHLLMAQLIVLTFVMGIKRHYSSFRVVS